MLEQWRSNRGCLLTHLSKMIQLILHHLYRGHLATITKFQEGLERGCVGIIEVNPAVECLPCNPCHSCQFRVDVVFCKIGCQVSEKRLPPELTVNLACGKQLLQHGDDPFLPLHLLFMICLSRDPSRIFPKKHATRGTFPWLRLVGSKDHLALLAIGTSIYQRALVAKTEGHDLKHPEKRLIERPRLHPPFGQTRGAPCWCFSQLPPARKITQPPGNG